MTKYKMPGLSVAIVREGEVVYARGFGFRDVESSAPSTPRTSYCVGSVTKAFTAAAIMQLVERGLISLDDSVSKYSDAVRDPEIKIHHLLTHTSGIPALGYAEMLIDTYYGFRTDALLSIATPDDVLVYMSEYEKHRFSADGGSWPFMFSDFMALHHLPLNGFLRDRPRATGVVATSHLVAHPRLPSPKTASMESPSPSSQSSSLPLN
jgi:hypothetical protein